ncbi:pre-toxin TG domain-containing protein, partial [Bacillus sp. FJAT-47783]|uniref:pre-toxin TG domain-containing protein n=1 Tax=Bacillus sp. FJAT-47783 TaxID=2922712 RepID=UPI001FAD30A6
QQVGELDQQWLHEYAVSEKNQGLVINLYRELMNATTKGGATSPMYFDEKAYHRSDIYQVKDEVDQATEAYIKTKEEQAEVRDLKEKAEEEANKPWYEKTWDGIATFTGEFTGYYDYKRTKEGIDPITGEKLSEADRVKAAAMAAAGFIPLIGWAGKAFKGGKAIYKTTKGINAASQALDTYKTTKTFDVLQKTEMGLYGLASANGFGEYITGYDMFGNKLTEEQRQASFVQGLLGLGAGYITVKGADGVTKDATNLATDFKNIGKDIQAKGSQVIGDTSRALKLDLTDSLSFAGAQGITRSNAADTVQHVPKENLMMKAEGVGGVGKGAGNNRQIDFTRGFDVDPKYSSYEQRVKTTPVNKGEWSNERAESLFISDKTGEIKKYLDEAGVDGVEYKNGMPDFSPFSKGEIKLENMTNDRKSNFSTADEELAKKWSTPEQKWTAEDIADWREDNKYTWHELNDLETIQLVPSKINSVFKHLGGVGEYNIKVKLGE